MLFKVYIVISIFITRQDRFQYTITIRFVDV